MSIDTAISWCDSTVNGAVGCDGCELWNPKAGVKQCFAGNLVTRYAGLSGWPKSFDRPELYPDRMRKALRWPDLTGRERNDKPWLNGYPRLIFLCDLSDPFTPSLPENWLAEWLGAIAGTPHIWILLTKQAVRMRKFFDAHECPKNLWVLVSVTSQANIRRVVELLSAKVHVRGVSYEPALGPLDLEYPEGLFPGGPRTCCSGFECGCMGKPVDPPLLYELDWVISGGASGQSAPPAHPDWFRTIRDQCAKARVPLFHKQNGEWREPMEGERYNTALGRAGRPPAFLVSATDGTVHCFTESAGEGSKALIRVGTKRSGRLLDGREYLQLPEVRR